MKDQNSSLMKIVVIGVGGTGCKVVNIVENENNLSNSDVNFIYIDSNENSLKNYEENSSILLKDDENTKNFDDVNVLKNATYNSLNLIKERIVDANIVIICSGFGGITGTGALPIIAKLSKEMGILTIAVVTTPFSYEGIAKEVNALAGLNSLKENIDVLIPISNNRILNNYPDIVVADMFKLINKLLKNTLNYFINLFSDKQDFKVSWNEVIQCLKDKKESYIGFGSGIGKNKISRAINQATDSKIIDTKFVNSKNVVMLIVADSSFTAAQINEVKEEIKQKTRTDHLNIILSFNTDKSLVNEIRVSLISTFSSNTPKEKSLEQDLLQKSQEILLKIGNTLENEMNGHITGELNTDQYSIEEVNNYIEDKNLNDDLIVSEESKDEDDIPFFLK